MAASCSERPPPVPFTPEPEPVVPVTLPKVLLVMEEDGFENCGVLVSWKTSIRTSSVVPSMGRPKVLKMDALFWNMPGPVKVLRPRLPTETPFTMGHVTVEG